MTEATSRQNIATRIETGEKDDARKFSVPSYPRVALRFSFKVRNGGAPCVDASGFPWRPPLNYPCNAHRGLRFNFPPSVSSDRSTSHQAATVSRKGIARIEARLVVFLGLPQFPVWRSPTLAIAGSQPPAIRTATMIIHLLSASCHVKCHTVLLGAAGTAGLQVPFILGIIPFAGAKNSFSIK